MADTNALHYYVVTDSTAIARMEKLREAAIAFGDMIMQEPPSRSQSLAMTALEECLMRAIQAIAMGSGEKKGK
jgi:hypothetical protein